VATDSPPTDSDGNHCHRSTAAYVEQLGTTHAKPSVKQHLATIRRLDPLVQQRRLNRH
jgi:hypothetical protein